MERIDPADQMVDLGDAANLTRGASPVGLPDTDLIQSKFGGAISDED